MTYTNPMLPPPRPRAVSVQRPAPSLTASGRKLPDILHDLRQQRLAVEAQIADLIDWLDATEPYSDFEPDDDVEDVGDDEPSLGSTCDYSGRGSFYVSAPSAVPDLEGDDPDLEPSLCGITVELRGNDQDLEEDAGADRESDPAESGIGDTDGLMEQVVRQYPGFGDNGFTRCIA